MIGKEKCWQRFNLTNWKPCRVPSAMKHVWLWIERWRSKPWQPESCTSWVLFWLSSACTSQGHHPGTSANNKPTSAAGGTRNSFHRFCCLLAKQLQAHNSSETAVLHQQRLWIAPDFDIRLAIKSDNTPIDYLRISGDLPPIAISRIAKEQWQRFKAKSQCAMETSTVLVL